MKNSIRLLVASVLLAGSTVSFADGAALYKTACFACHDVGIAGAPKFADKKLWAPRIATGIDAMVKTVITGKGAMPPNGGTQLTEAQIREVVEYMANAASGDAAPATADVPASEAPATEVVAESTVEVETKTEVVAEPDAKTVVIVTDTVKIVVTGNVDSGKAKAAACVACHGPDGNSIAPNFPNLAGQSESFLFKQLQDFKAGKRKDATMDAMIMPLDVQAMQDIAAFFASQKLKTGQADPGLAESGKAIYMGGIAEIGVPACMACHGPSGSGNPGSGFPQLASQKSIYTEKQLKDFRTAAQNPADAALGRTNDASKMMRNAVKRMSDPEIKAVAQYIQGLQP
ncbi:MAG: c-type cytochrome [gamma proteobacterium symbiont of Taylorina sp.]|nr:c-type cytochrome [gamma proteobacterium symbiont of Taylorina sp.]